MKTIFLKISGKAQKNLELIQKDMNLSNPTETIKCLIKDYFFDKQNSLDVMSALFDDELLEKELLSLKEHEKDI
jgi:hypothetical protein